MHRCLQIPEISHLICKHAHSNRTWEDIDGHIYYASESTQATGILALAQSCKHFYEPAVSAIWSVLTSPQPLIRCMDSSLYEVDEMGALTLLRPIQSSDIAILLKYTHRIRHLEINEAFPSACLPVQVYHAFSLLLSGMSWTPNLQGFTLVMESHSNSLPFLRFFAGAYLKNLHISTFHNNKINGQFALITFLTIMHKEHPRLTSLDLSDLGKCMYPALSGALRKYHDLVDLKIPMLDEVAMRHIASLPALRNLVLQSSLDPNEDLKSHVSDDIRRTSSSDHHYPTISPFPSLRSLKLLHLDQFSHFTRFFSLLTGQLRLETLSLWADEDWAIDDVSTIITAIAQSVSAETLTFLSVNAYEDCLPESPGNPPATGILIPLKKFFNLKTLIITTEQRPYVSDEDIADLCSAWPKLTILAIRNQVKTAPKAEKGVTIQAVVSAVSACKDLRSLTLAFDARAAHLPDVVDNVVSRHFCSLDAGCSPIDKTAPVASLLHGMFPMLQMIDAIDWEDEEERAEASREEKRWRNVDIGMRKLRREASKLAKQSD